MSKNCHNMIEALARNPRNVVVTRHPALVRYLKEQGLVDENTTILSHVTKNDILGDNVYGVLPLSLARYAKSITEVNLELPPEKRGAELSIEEIRLYARGISRYVVHAEDQCPRCNLFGEDDCYPAPK